MGAAPFLAPALVGLRDEANEAFPKRDKASDGWIGDVAHASSSSDHNPCWSCTGNMEAVVRAIDLDISPDGRADADLRTRLLDAVVGDARVWYVISNGKIYSRTYGWAARVYTGPNGHFQHVHVSLQGRNGISAAQAWEIAYDTAKWGVEDTRVSPPKDPPLPPVSLTAAVHAARKPSRSVHPGVVSRIQRALLRRGYQVTVDGVYGPSTYQAMKAWEKKIGKSDPDGIPGSWTLTRLGAKQFRVTR